MNPREREEVNLRITGHVQGVFFRQTVQAWAQELRVTGMVHNEPDGSLVVWAQGKREALETLVRRCYHGPEHASVARVEERWRTPQTHYSSFTIT